jgi:hypothetical protein
MRDRRSPLGDFLAPFTNRSFPEILLIRELGLEPLLLILLPERPGRFEMVANLMAEFVDLGREPRLPIFSVFFDLTREGRPIRAAVSSAGSSRPGGR